MGEYAVGISGSGYERSRALVNMLMNLWLLYNDGNVL
jgi:hypothetical protein